MKLRVRAWGESSEGHAAVEKVPGREQVYGDVYQRRTKATAFQRGSVSRRRLDGSTLSGQRGGLQTAHLIEQRNRGELLPLSCYTCKTGSRCSDFARTVRRTRAEDNKTRSRVGARGADARPARPRQLALARYFIPSGPWRCGIDRWRREAPAQAVHRRTERLTVCSHIQGRVTGCSQARCSQT